MSNTNNNNNNDDDNKGWTKVGSHRSRKNNERRKIKKQQRKNEEQQLLNKQKYYETQQENYNKQKKNNWRQQRIALIKQKEIEEYKSRRITMEFSQAIQHERSKANISRKDLALKIMIQESELALYENAQKCPPSRIVVELRKVFENLPRQYFTLE